MPCLRSLGSWCARHSLAGTDREATKDLVEERCPPPQNGVNPIVFDVSTGKLTDDHAKQAVSESVKAIAAVPHVASPHAWTRSDGVRRQVGGSLIGQSASCDTPSAGGPSPGLPPTAADVAHHDPARLPSAPARRPPRRPWPSPAPATGSPRTCADPVASDVRPRDVQRHTAP